MMYAAVVHGGAGGTSSEAEEGCRAALRTVERILERGGFADEAVVEGVEQMEDSGEFNAGTAAVLRYLPEGVVGEVQEMDAVFADSDGRVGTVAVVRNILNPIRLAFELAHTPHPSMAGEGARAFAESIGLPPHPGPTERVRERLRVLKEAIARGDLAAIGRPDWTVEDLHRFLSGGHGTVGITARDKRGKFAAASSTGGSGPMPPGRVGDVTVKGAGYEISQIGAVLATGYGEWIRRREGSAKVFALLEQGVHPQLACERIALDTELFPTNIDVGFIAITEQGVGVAANCEMASAKLIVL